MRTLRAIGISALLVSALAVAGCQEGTFAGSLRSAGVGSTPDEFLVLPTRPLEMPTDLRTLPPPAPGTVNRVDYRPQNDVITGLTGRPGALNTANGSALVAQTGAGSSQVRVQLAVEDAEWRRTHRGLLFERWFSSDKTALAYREQTLDAPIAFDRLQAQGVRVPPASPSVLSQD